VDVHPLLFRVPGLGVQGGGRVVLGLRSKFVNLGAGKSPGSTGEPEYNVQCVRETEILVEQQPPQGVLVCDHAGRVTNKFALNRVRQSHHARVLEGVIGFRSVCEDAD